VNTCEIARAIKLRYVIVVWDFIDVNPVFTAIDGGEPFVSIVPPNVEFLNSGTIRFASNALMANSLESYVFYEEMVVKECLDILVMCRMISRVCIRARTTTISALKP